MSDHDLGTYTVTPKFHVPTWKCFHEVLCFTEKGKSRIKASLEYIGRCIKEVVAARWEKLFYRLRMLADDTLNFWIGGS